MSCHNNPNLFEDETTLARWVEWKKNAGMEADSCSAVINVAASETELSLMLLSNGLIAQLILFFADPFLMLKQLYFPQISIDTG